MGEIFSVKKSGDIAIVEILKQEITMYEIDKVEKEFSDIIEKESKNLLVNFKKLEFISSLVIAALVYLHKKAKENDGIIFEGMGRMEPEARLFAEVCGWLGRDFRVLHLKVSEAVVAERLRKRREIEGREDDYPLIVRNRLKNFYEHTAPAIEYFRSINKVIDINGEPLPDAVFAELWQKVSAL